MYCRQCGARLEDGLYYCPSCGAEQGSEAPSAAASTTAAPVRCVWPEWEMEDAPIGRGSFGTVYKAVRRDYDVESYAAIKVISIPSDPAEVESLRADGMDENASRTYLEGVVRDFIGEVRVMESLKGAPNIVSVEDYKVVEKQGEIGWDIYIRMELLTPFAQHSAGRTVTEAEVIRLGVDICTALELCGRRSIIHRDIKPENIFIDRFGQFKLGDFGIARKLENMTGGLSQKGTFNYMAPEVASGRTYDARVDIYSLGIVLYRLLNGNRLPFLSTDRQLLNPNDRRMALERRLSGQPLPVPCDASPAMAAVILRACAYDPNDRFVSALEMKQALLRAAGGDRTPTPAPVDDRTIRVRHPEQGGEAPAADERLYPRPRTPQEETASVYRPFGGGGDTVGIRTGIGGTETVDARPDRPEAEHKTAFCARCGAQVPIQQRFCPQCGLEQPVPVPESMPPKMQPTSGGKTRWWLIAACAVAAVAVIVGAVLLWPSAETSRATETAKATETVKATAAPTPKATEKPKAAESVPVVDSAPVDEKLEDYKEYVAAYAVAMALDDNEKTAVQEAIDACITADKVESCQYLTPMYWNGIILYYPEWVEAGCPVADVGSYNATAFSTMNGFSAVTDGVECWDDGSIIATCTYTKPNTETEQYSYSITFGLSVADVVVDFAGHIGDSFSGAMDSYSVEQSLEWFQVFVPGVTYYYRAEIREGSSYWDGEVIAAGDIKSFTVPQREIESIELGQSKTVEGWGDAEFSFTPAAGGEYTVELSADGAVDVFNSAGEVMAGNYPTFNTHSGKTYYIRITNYSGSSQVITLTK